MVDYVMPDEIAWLEKEVVPILMTEGR